MEAPSILNKEGTRAVVETPCSLALYEGKVEGCVFNGVHIGITNEEDIVNRFLNGEDVTLEIIKVYNPITREPFESHPDCGY